MAYQGPDFEKTTTFQPPPPTGAPQAGRPAAFEPQGRPASFDPSALGRADWAVLGAGVLALLFSFFDYYTYSVSIAGYSASSSASAWHGFFGWVGALSALAGAAALFAEQIGRLPVNVPGRLATLGGFALATVCTLLALVIFPGAGSGYGVHAGHGFGYWASLLVILVGLGVSYRRFTAAGGVLPWRDKA
ncbi:MAG TPA: hypothetical protein VH372_16085 [Actinospica sp.]|jgi:hypothetical protein|nr:hypothetical protein [Actinospica sp.]